ncbi:methyltransferase [Streptosporangium sp. NPDC050855]|uniref:methyltransferase n=1 Tax=Streptosporangium sp. NPDC050855 TaxID=3366194 RepID=UPI0037B48639
MSDKADMSARLWSLAHLGTPMAIRVAATLRIADRVAAEPRSARELAEQTGAHADALERVLRHLAAKGVLSRDDAGRYALTPLGEPLRTGHPAHLRDMLDIDGAVGRAELSLVRLLHSVRTGEAAYPVQFGRPFWDDLAANPALAASFDARMGADAVERAGEIVSACDWGALGHVVDVGGGDGTLMIALLTRFPALRGTVVDLPGTAETARKALAEAGLADRGDVVPGSFFEPLPRGRGGYLLSSVVHDWDDEAARTILRRCAEAAGDDGSVFVIERIGPDGESPHTAMDLRMLAYYGGKERRAAELAALAADAGLEAVAVHPAGRLSVIEFTAARRPAPRREEDAGRTGRDGAAAAEGQEGQEGRAGRTGTEAAVAAG